MAHFEQAVGDSRKEKRPFKRKKSSTEQVQGGKAMTSWRWKDEESDTRQKPQ